MPSDEKEKQIKKTAAATRIMQRLERRRSSEKKTTQDKQVQDIEATPENREKQNHSETSKSQSIESQPIIHKKDEERESKRIQITGDKPVETKRIQITSDKTAETKRIQITKDGDSKRLQVPEGKNSQSSEAEAPKEENSESKRTYAANRIINRLEKSKVEKTETSSEVAPKTPQKEIQKMYEMKIKGDIAKVYYGLQRKFLSEEDVLEAFWVQLRYKKKDSILDILKQRDGLSSEHEGKIANVEEIIVHHSESSKPNPLDFAIAQLILDYKLLEKEEVQQTLGLVASLYKVGIYKRLDDLLIERKILSIDIVKPLVVQCVKGYSEKKKNVEEASKIEPIYSAARTEYPVITITSLLLIIITASFFMIVKKNIPKEKKTIVVEIQPLVENQPNKQLGKNQPSKPIETDPSQKLEWKKEESRRLQLVKEKVSTKTQIGYVKWDTQWILPEWEKALLEMNYTKGTRPPARLFILKAKNIRIQTFYGKNNLLKMLIISGRLYGHSPLPKMLNLKMQLRIFHPFQRDACCSTKTFALDSIHRFRIIVEFPVELPVSLYWIYFTLPARSQEKFLQYFYHLKKNQYWRFPFLLKTPRKIQNEYTNTKFKVENKLKLIWKQYKKLKKWMQKNSEDKVRDEKWFREFREIAKDIEFKAKKSTLYTESTKRIFQLYGALHQIYQTWKNWQRDIVKQSPNLSDKCDLFEISYNEIQLMIQKEHKKLLKTLEENKARAITTPH